MYTYVFLCLTSGNLDDEIADIVYENRGNLPDMDSITHLTADDFHAAVAQSSLTVVLFYLKCKTVCTLGDVNVLSLLEMCSSFIFQ